MTDLEKYRDQIDETDTAIVQLFEKRMKLVEQVADYKIKSGKNVFDQKRETEKLAALEQKASNTFNAIAVRELFEQMMAISRKHQYQLLTENGVTLPVSYTATDELHFKNARVVFQGVEGAYSFGAMKAFFDDSIESMNVKTWREAMEIVADGKADFGVLPIENTTAGSVSDIYDLLMQFNNYIVGEQVISVDHKLMGVPGTKLSDIKQVYSHPQALAQCGAYLRTHEDWQLNETLNTAAAAQKIAEEGRRDQVAIASKEAAEHFGLEILEEQRLSLEENSTRFIIISANKCFVRSARKISLCFGLPHECGTLYNMLSHLIFNGLNMTKIESRPIPDHPFEFRFFIDFEGNLADSAVKNALAGIEAEAGEMRILGNY